MSWIVNGLIPEHRRMMDAGPEGSCKSIWESQLTVCIASGRPFLGHSVKQGHVLLVNEETLKGDLEKWLDRFSQGIGYKSYKELPITVLSKTGFRIHRAEELKKLLPVIQRVKPLYTSLDSLTAMYPSGRQGLSENDLHIGEYIRDDLDEIIKAGTTPCLIVHSSKSEKTLSYTPQDLTKISVQDYVRGHGSIVGEGCDVALLFKFLSERPEPTRFAVIPKSRRTALPLAGNVMYLEVKEEEYGKGWARLEKFRPDSLPPSDYAKDVFGVIRKVTPITSSKLRTTCALLSRKEIKMAIQELLVRKVILDDGGQNYRLNPNYQKEVNRDYLKRLY